jgi:hypothetical protein
MEHKLKNILLALFHASSIALSAVISVPDEPLQASAYEREYEPIPEPPVITTVPPDFNYLYAGLTAETAEPVTARYDLTDGEKRLLCFVSDSEDSTSVESRQSVMQTVLNRVYDERFPDNVTDVLYAPKQFQVMKTLSDDYTPSDEALEALERILYGEDIFGGANVLFFSAADIPPHRIAKGLYAVAEIGGTIFYGQEE